MKVKAKQFNFKNNERPKVLFLGNGLCRAFNGGDWDNIIAKMGNEKIIISEDVPMTVKASVKIEGDVSEKIAEYCKEAMKNRELDKFFFQRSELIKRFLSIGFDYVITTNYTYEVENALLGKPASQSQLEKAQRHVGIKNAEKKYSIHTFDEFGNQQIWHIHGQMRKPNSMVLTNYYYGELIFKYKDYIDKNAIKRYRKQTIERGTLEIKSWIDAFLFGNVYMVGFGMDLSEIDLWWLLEEKDSQRSRSHMPFGRIIFFEPQKVKNKRDRLSSDDCKYLLFEKYGVEFESLNYRVLDSNTSEETNKLYQEFYEKVCEHLQNSIG